MTSRQLVLWGSNDPVKIPDSENDPKKIVEYAKQFSSSSARQIVLAFENESYEMATSFIMTKAMSSLKKQIASLGMAFVGEMLARTDIDEHSTEDSITDYEAVTLAQDLGMFSSTEGLRLRQSLQTVTHFASLDDSEIEEDGMTLDEARMCLRTCIKNILGHPKINAAEKFVEFREQLGSTTLNARDVSVRTLKDSPYFYRRTTLTVLLAMLKKATGAQLQHAVENAKIVIPQLWDGLKKPERWQTGQTYAVVSSEGNVHSANALKSALLAVHGFDYVPETLRSDSYITAANNVLEAHFGSNNFYNEPAPMRELYSLGTTIPMPAFPRCMSAILCVYLGNSYNISFDAARYAERMLGNLSEEQWNYYFDECFPQDRRILEKVYQDTKPLRRMMELVKSLRLGSDGLKNPRSKKIVEALGRGSGQGVVRPVKALLKDTSGV